LLRVYNIPGLDSINDIRNGFLWAERIEDAYTANQVCMIYHPFHARLVFVVVDASILDVDLGVIDENGDTLHFSDVHCKHLDVAPEQMPNLRLLLNQALFAMDLASERGWERPPEFESIFALLNAMRDMVKRLVADGDGDSSDLLDQWANEHPQHDTGSVRM
jgi:hypothetical protein